MKGKHNFSFLASRQLTFSGKAAKIFFQSEAAAANYLFPRCFPGGPPAQKENPHISAGAFS